MTFLYDPPLVNENISSNVVWKTIKYSIMWTKGYYEIIQNRTLNAVILYI